MHRGITFAVPGLALATVGGMWVEVRRAANAPVPHFEDLDPSGTYGDPSAPPVRISVLGDSSVTGPGLDHGASTWMAVLADRLPHDVELRSFARGGSRVRDVLVEQVPAAMREATDLFVVAVGANDAIHVTPGRRFARDLLAVLQELRSAAPVVSLGIGDLSMIPRVPASLRVALARRCIGFDRVHRRITDDLEQVLRVPVSEVADPHFRPLGRSVFAQDLFHPNERGHAIWAERFEPYVRSALGGTIDLRDLGRPALATT